MRKYGRGGPRRSPSIDTTHIRLPVRVDGHTCWIIIDPRALAQACIGVGCPHVSLLDGAVRARVE